MDYEQKYKDALKRASNLHKDAVEMENTMTTKTCEIIFPELAESEDERIRKGIIRSLEYLANISEGFVKDELKERIAWLEKQKVSKNKEQAEQEKMDFVSGNFIQCRKSFNEFKEDESYWFEYIGDDTYIGRSDNILNKKFHITPRQLYKLFSQQHDYKQEEAQDEQNEIQEPMSYGKEIDEAMYEACRRYDLPYTDADKYSLADVFHAGVRAAEQKNNEWSEEDEEYRLSAIKYLEELDAQGTHGSRILPYINWLRSLRPQPRQKWCKEDEDMVYGLIIGHEILIDNTACEQLRDIYLNELNWLKSLVSRPIRGFKEEDDKCMFNTIEALVTNNISLSTDEQEEILYWLKGLYQRYYV